MSTALAECLDLLPNGYRLIEDGQVIPAGHVLRIDRNWPGEWTPYDWPFGLDSIALASHTNYYAVRVSDIEPRKEW